MIDHKRWIEKVNQAWRWTCCVGGVLTMVPWSCDSTAIQPPQINEEPDRPNKNCESEAPCRWVTVRKRQKAVPC